MKTGPGFESEESIITSEKGNNYLYSRAIPQVLFINPILNHLLQLLGKGIDIEEWLNKLDDTGLEIEDGIKASKKEIKYYFDYLGFLKENHYFDKVTKHRMTGSLYTADAVKFQLANTRQIIFEVTSSCSLKCKYCGYGELYTGFNKRDNKKLRFETAKRVFDYIKELFESPLNRNRYKRIAISFYGGEPLLNMPFIKRMISYAGSNKISYKDYLFTMTTNAADLDKHMDFLAENDFHILISLDGDERSNGYRLFPDGSPSFPRVFNNILKLKTKYPDYFENSVRFMAVVHNKNSYKEIKAFFQEHLGKEPQISQVNAIGIRPEKRDEFNRIFKKKYTGLKTRDILADIKDKTRILKTPITKQLASFIKRRGGFVFESYDPMLNKKENARIVSTGTCLPFERKIFITTNGEILTCERILHRYSLGKVDENGVCIDFQEVADRYNAYYKKIMDQCNRCARSENCPVCIFSLDLNDDHPTCPDFKCEEDFPGQLQHSLSLLEDAPQFYPRIMREYRED